MSWRFRRVRLPHLAVAALVVAGGLSLAFHGTILGQTPPHAPPVPPEAIASVQQRMETAHQRGSAKQAGDDDGVSSGPADDSARPAPAQSSTRNGAAITPEKAVTLARQALQGDDDRLVSVSLHTQDGVQVYVVKFRSKSVSIDANTGSVLSTR